jgi:hypothetical protein
MFLCGGIGCVARHSLIGVERSARWRTGSRLGAVCEHTPFPGGCARVAALAFTAIFVERKHTSRGGGVCVARHSLIGVERAARGWPGSRLGAV